MASYDLLRKHARLLQHLCVVHVWLQDGYSSCNWKSVELLHQCKGNVNNYFALWSCVVLFWLCLFLHVNKSSQKIVYIFFFQILRHLLILCPMVSLNCFLCKYEHSRYSWNQKRCTLSSKSCETSLLICNTESNEGTLLFIWYIVLITIIIFLLLLLWCSLKLFICESQMCNV